mmetsp:Transcript_2160/g.2223  ORF Transcript_2160/g.2223 Transcript_2160/m.2223 type:complete len:88 (+) Transcript_2160:42-305(+)
MNHDLAGIEGLIKVHQEHISKIKFYNRVDNEIYLREHPELEFILENFLIKLLEDRPTDVFKYAGSHFNSTDFRTLYKNKLINQAQNK